MKVIDLWLGEGLKCVKTILSVFSNSIPRTNYCY